jgi:phenylacetate-coenzyme A ligase PaaK-like adenylate-forming protein
MKQDKSDANHCLTFLGASWDAWKATREGTQGIARRQQERLQAVVSFARAHSDYFADRYREVPEPCTDIRQLPVVTKAEMIRHFEAWVTDPAVTQQGVTAFIADPSLIGHDYLGRYVVCTTSGSTGIPAILIGRTDEILSFPTQQGGVVQILQLAIATVVEEVLGVYNCQIIQMEPLKLKVRLAVKEPAEEQLVWEALQTRLVGYLAAQGITDVTIEKAPEPPQLHPKSGKFRQVWSYVKRWGNTCSLSKPHRA